MEYSLGALFLAWVDYKSLRSDTLVVMLCVRGIAGILLFFARIILVWSAPPNWNLGRIYHWTIISFSTTQFVTT